MEIKIGTSGYSFDDWKGPFYPKRLPKGKMFDHYINHFNTVEINATYYRIPPPAVMATIEKKSPDNFEFMIKVPGSATHKRRDLADDIRHFDECMKPMTESGKLKGLLAQFPYSFKFNQTNLDYLKSCRDNFSQAPLYVEFRHNSWVNRTMYDNFRANDIGYVAVDEPQISAMLKPDLFNTTDTAYIRLHGRNAEQWWDGGALRYDYDYSKNELENWKAKIKKLENKAKKLFIFFNNCHLGQAVKNAQEMVQMLKLN